MMVQFIKGVTCTVCNAKSIDVKELSEMLGNNSQMEDGKKDPRCILSQDSGNDIVDDMECDPLQPLSDSYQKDQLPSESDENSPSQQDQSLCDNSDSNHPSSLLEHTLSHMESPSHRKFEF